jgi:hypothetical protein
VDAGSNDADKGTACHAVLERVLKHGGDAASFIGKKISVGEDGHRAEIEITAEMAGWVHSCVAWVATYKVEHPGCHVRSEARVHVGRVFRCPDDLWGTADVVIDAGAELVVADAKFGYNAVQVEDNPQIILYAIGGANDYGWVHEEYRLAVLQPQDGEPKVKVYTKRELLDYVGRYAPKIQATFDPDAPLVPSDAGCHWCPAAGVCPELQRRALVLAQREFASVETLSVDNLGMLVVQAERIRAGLDAAERHARQLMQLGKKVPGLKLVAGDKRRVWKDRDAARKVLIDDLGYTVDDVEPRDMITPAQAEKLVGSKTKKLLASLIEKPKGEATVVSEDDPRESLTPDFEKVEIEELPGTAPPGVTDLL